MDDDGVEARIIGVDLSAGTRKTDACVFTFMADNTVRVAVVPNRPTSRRTNPPIDDARLELWLHGRWSTPEDVQLPTLVGIDAPFGWPTPFTSAIEGWMGTEARWPGWDRPRDARRAGAHGAWHEPAEFLSYRATDRFVRLWRRQQRHVTDRRDWPDGISVSADQIAVTAFRAARVLSRCGRVERHGTTGPALEVYPGAALAEWGLYRDYRSTPEAADDLINNHLIPGFERLSTGTDLDAGPVLDSLRQGPVGRQMRARHHVFDAVVAAVCSWAALVGRTYPPPGLPGAGSDDTANFLREENRHRASLEGLGPARALTVAAEGWIHHPSCKPTEALAIDPLEGLRARAC